MNAKPPIEQQTVWQQHVRHGTVCKHARLRLSLHAAYSAHSAKRLRRAARPKTVANAAIAASIPIYPMRRACRSWVLSVPAPSLLLEPCKQLSTATSSSSLMAAGEGHGVFHACCAWYMGHSRSTVATTSRVGHTRSPSGVLFTYRVEGIRTPLPYPHAYPHAHRRARGIQPKVACGWQ